MGSFRTLLMMTMMLAAAGVPGLAGGAESPPAELAEGTFGSALEAVLAASAAVQAASLREDREYLGGIFRHGAEYRYSVAPGQAGHDRIRVRLRRPVGYELVALWHTHGAAAPERRYFSRTDGDLVEQTGLPLYLADPAGVLRVLHPGAPRLSGMAARALGLGTRSGAAVGEAVQLGDGRTARLPARGRS
jgi:hypothetical protein